jgi:hypothetical protein
MSASNLTPNYLLPQFVSTDKPSWLGDVNGAMVKIDAALASLQAEINTQVTNLNAQVLRINTAAARIVALDHGTTF